MILVIGGTGKAGREVVRQLAEIEVLTRVLVRNPKTAHEVKELGLEAVEGDLTNVAGIEAALRGIEKVFILVPPSQNEAELKSSIINAAKKMGVKHVVMLSGAGATHDSPISQARQHAKADDYLRASNLPFTILRPYFFMQNFLAQAEIIKSQGAIYGNYKDGRLAMVDTRDIAAVARACLTEDGHEGRIYIITGGEPIAHAEVAEKLSRVLGRKIKYMDLSSEQLVEGLTSMGYPEWLANDLARLGENIATGQFASKTDVVEKIAKKNPFTFDQFVKDNASTFS
ncbi:MAG: SDR family oxidoreductase [Nitrospirae bacterium]|nr:SDR family oxidoreductase [Nitrospirota bacterium]